jgi:tetratricopeptide (TPR) repeat protein
MYKKGEDLAEAGMYREALVYYESSLSRNPNYIKSQIGLKKTGQRVLDEKLQVFYAANASEQHKEAVYAYLDAESLVKRAKGFGVVLDIPGNYKSIYEESEKIYITALYRDAQADLDNELFDSAREKFKEISRIEPGFKDASDLESLSEAEPLYRKALAAYDQQLYRKAYGFFNSIHKIRPGYKETSQLMAICLERARYTIGILEFQNGTPVKGLERAISSSIAQGVLAKNDPFLVLVDRTKTEEMLNEQKLSLTGKVDAQSSARAGELLGAKALMTGKIIAAEVKQSPLVREQKRGYQATPYTYKDPETGRKETRYTYRKTYYDQFQQDNKVTVTFEYKVVSAETGEILASEVVEETLTDQVQYATYSGDARYLYMGSWSQFNRDQASDRILNNNNDKRNLDRMLSARQTLKPTSELQADVIDRIGNRVAKSLVAINPERE